MSIQTEIDRIINAVDAAHQKVAEKGGTTARPYLVANLAEAIDTIPEASDPVMQQKTVSPTTSSQTVKPDSGYDGLSQVTVNAMPTATQATPSISVSTSGLITASATQTAGYVAAGTKSATKQLTTQAAQTITPGTSNKTIASGRYLTGTQTIKGDANLKADNITEGVSIFGVAGSNPYEKTTTTTEIASQTSLISQIQTALEGKAAGGGGTTPETCTVVLNKPELNTDGHINYYMATCYNENTFSSVLYSPEDPSISSYPIIIENVVCGSPLFVSAFGASVPGWKVDYSLFTRKTSYIGLFGTITAKAGDTLTITYYNND